MANQMPLLTVATLCYNTGKFVIESLECVKQQGYPNMQHIIIDDCSSDNSVELIKEWIGINGYPCTFIKHEINRGVQFGLQEVFQLAQGKYIVFISDDLWLGNSFITLVKQFESLDESYAMIYGDTKMIDQDGLVIRESMFEFHRGKEFEPPSGDIFREVVKDFFFWIQSSIIRVSHFKLVINHFDPKVISEDWDWQLALSREFNILGLNEPFGLYRYREGSVGRTNWVPEKISAILISQANMLLKYYSHPKNDEHDNYLIFEKVWRLFLGLEKNRHSHRMQKLTFLKNFYLVTKRWELLFAMVSLFLHFGSGPIKRLLFHKMKFDLKQLTQ